MWNDVKERRGIQTVEIREKREWDKVHHPWRGKVFRIIRDSCKKMTKNLLSAFGCLLINSSFSRRAILDLRSRTEEGSIVDIKHCNTINCAIKNCNNLFFVLRLIEICLLLVNYSSLSTRMHFFKNV
jgi:hypothetical protein